MNIGRFFLYEEKVVPYILGKDGLNLKWRIFGNWMPSLCGNDFSEENSSRIKGLDLDDLGNIFKGYDGIQEKDKIIILSDPDHRTLFDVDGTHSDIYQVSQRGVDYKTGENFLKNLRGKGLLKTEFHLVGTPLSSLMRNGVFDFIK